MYKCHQVCVSRCRESICATRLHDVPARIIFTMRPARAQQSHLYSIIQISRLHQAAFTSRGTVAGLVMQESHLALELVGGDCHSSGSRPGAGELAAKPTPGAAAVHIDAVVGQSQG